MIKFRFGDMHGMSVVEGDIMSPGSSVVVELIRTWRKHTKVSTLAAPLNCAPTAILKLKGVQISKGLGT